MSPHVVICAQVCPLKIGDLVVKWVTRIMCGLSENAVLPFPVREGLRLKNTSMQGV